MKRVVIVHGYTGYADKNWFPWLKAKLQADGVEVIAPDLPNTNAPKLTEWLPYLQHVVGPVDEQTYFVGHSLGCATILRLLEALPDGAKAGGVVLVAGFAEPISLTQLDSFTTDPWNDAHIKNATDGIIAINSDDDPYVPLEMGERLRDRLNAELVVMPGAKHINEKAGFTEVPLIYDSLTKLLK